jgi:pyruvate formate lyase activating enzyme
MLPLASRAQREFGIHIEIVTNLMPGFNDSDEHARRLAARLVSELGADTPYHLTSFVPYAFMLNVPPTPPETLQRVKSIAHEAGLRFVYTDSLAVPGDASTRCPLCEALLIERRAGAVYLRDLDEHGDCGACGARLGIVTRQTRQSRNVCD